MSERQPAPTTHNIDLAIRHHHEGRLAEAAALYQRVLWQDPKHPDALRLLGLISSETGKPHHAVELLTKAIQNKPGMAEAHDNLGTVLRTLGKLPDAIVRHKKAISLKPDFPEAYYNLGSALQELDRLDDALAYYGKALTLKPALGEAYNSLVVVLQKLGRLSPKATSLADERYMRIKRCRHGVMLYNINDAYIGRSLDLYGEYSEEEVGVFRQILKPGMVSCDIGANIGCLTIFMAKTVGPKGRVVAFEPNRITFQTLCANVAANALTNVETHFKAVGTQVGEILVPEICFDKVGNFGALSLQTYDHGEKVSLTTLDAFSLDNCHFIKIDVEGMESAVVRGAQQTIKKFKPILYVENDRPESSDELIQLLHYMDYRLFWHQPPLFNGKNFFECSVNIFGNIVSKNMLCIPKDSSISISDMQEITEAH